MSPEKISVPAPEFEDIEIEDIEVDVDSNDDDSNPTWNPEEILDGIKLVPHA